MDKKSLVNVRNVLFETIDRLMDAKDDTGRNGLKPIDLETAKAVTNACQAIIDSARIEMNVLKSIANAQNPELLVSFVNNSGVIETGAKLLEGKEKEENA